MLPAVVDPAHLEQRRAEVVVADVRWYLDGRSGRAAYEAGHLPGAVFVDLDRDLTGGGLVGGGRHPLPDPVSFAEAMSRLGIGDGTTVIAYDDQGGIVASRLVWMLRVLGHEAALLDGGMAAVEVPLEQAEVPVVRRRFSPRPWPADRLAGVDEAIDPARVVLDARSLERFRGDLEPVDARAGHIPGARSLPCTGNLGPDGRFLSPARLRARFEAAGVGEDSSVVAYCGSGVSACHNLLALELAGLGRGRLYPGSWSHYATLVDRPVETGDPRKAGG